MGHVPEGWCCSNVSGRWQSAGAVTVDSEIASPLLLLGHDTGKDGPDLEPDTSPRGVQNADEHQFRLIPLPDRRQYRVSTPEYSRCGWDDQVTVVAAVAGR